MSEPHTPGRVTFREDGDANHWSMLTQDGRWLLALLHNGQAPSARQVANFRRLAACWNACEGVPTEILEAYPAPFTGLRTQRDELLTALESTLEGMRVANQDLVGSGTSLNEEIAEAEAAIAKVKGRAT